MKNLNRGRCILQSNLKFVFIIGFVTMSRRPVVQNTPFKKAVHDKLTRKYTYKEVSEKYNVPIAVIFNRIKGRKTPIIKNGREAVFSEECEKKIEGCLIARSRMGHPCDKTEVKLLVGEYIKQNNLITPLKDSVPGNDWYYNFMKRHPLLSFKKPEQLQKLRKDARKPEIVYDFYEKLKNVYVQNDLFSKGKFIFNADESGFNTDTSSYWRERKGVE